MNIYLAFKNPRLLRAVTGLSVQEFNDLLPLFAHRLHELACQKDRLRKAGGGRRGALPDAAHKLFFILLYLKVYPTYDLAGLIFGVDRSRPCRWVDKYLPVLEEVLKRKCLLPKRRITSVQEFLEAFSETKDVFIDGTERRVQRPKSDKSQKRRYSGKKKTHTRKNLIASDSKKKILVVSPTKNGRIHDKRLFDKELWRHWIPPDVSVWLDTGFIGVGSIGEEVFMPKKKSKNHPLTTEEKQTNKAISSIRVVVEHAIGGIKRFAATTHVYRNKKQQDDPFIAVAAGLWNLHLAAT